MFLLSKVVGTNLFIQYCLTFSRNSHKCIYRSIECVAWADVSPPPRETSLNGDERGETFAIRRLYNVQQQY